LAPELAQLSVPTAPVQCSWVPRVPEGEARSAEAQPAEARQRPEPGLVRLVVPAPQAPEQRQVVRPGSAQTGYCRLRSPLRGSSVGRRISRAWSSSSHLPRNWSRSSIGPSEMDV